VLAIGPYEHDDAIVRPAEAHESLLAVITVVFIRDHRSTESGGAARQVDTVFSKISAAFRRIVARHDYCICDN
jgi:hypothetical protein